MARMKAYYARIWRVSMYHSVLYKINKIVCIVMSEIDVKKSLEIVDVNINIRVRSLNMISSYMNSTM